MNSDCTSIFKPLRAGITVDLDSAWGKIWANSDWLARNGENKLAVSAKGGLMVGFLSSQHKRIIMIVIIVAEQQNTSNVFHPDLIDS